MSKETLRQRREQRTSCYGLHSLLATSTRCSQVSVYAVLMLNGETLLSLLFCYLFFFVTIVIKALQFYTLYVVRWDIDYAQLHSNDSHHVHEIAHV